MTHSLLLFPKLPPCGSVSRRGLLLAAVWAVAVSGCSRMFWRSQADFDTYNLLMQKTQDPRWDLPRLTVQADPRSRFYDVFDPDRAPLPPDDPAAHRYMERVHGMRGYKNWYKFGELDTVENPTWLSQFPFESEMAIANWERAPREEKSGVLERAERMVPTVRDLTLEQAIELANIHSRDYQFQIENVYLSALVLTFDQFRFNVRYLGLNGVEPTSSLTYFNTPSVRDDLQYNNRFGVSQLLPTGGQWAMELANNTLWLLSGPNQTNSASVLSYSLVQPLMLGAGRKIALENLTLSERAVLYDVRSLARFRKIFFSDVVVNGNGGGYLGLLRQLQAIRNTQSNLDALIKQVRRLREVNNELPTVEPLDALPEDVLLPENLANRLQFRPMHQELSWTGPMTEAERDQLLALSASPAWRTAISNLFSKVQAGVVTLDLAQLLTRLGQQQINLRNQENTFLDALDSYKLELGLPTDFQITLDTSLLDQFQLIDPQVNEVEASLIDFKDAMAQADQEGLTIEELRLAAEGIELLRQKVQRDGLALVDRDFERVRGMLPKRLAELTDPRDQEVTQKDYERSRIVYQSVVLDAFNALTNTIAGIRGEAAREDLTADERDDLFNRIDQVRERLVSIAQSLKAVQASLRSELISLAEFDMTQEECVQLALDNRLDLMNERANVMDFRRQMEVAANRLEAVLNVVARGDVGTEPGNRPLDFRGDRSTFQMGLQFTAPLDMVQERNAYRTAQIAYQRARRDYMNLEDNIKLTVRNEWRALQRLRRNFETSRQNLRISALQLDSAIENFNAPARPGQAGAGAGGGQQNLGLNLIQALDSVLQAQNTLIQIWVQYEQNRINIHRDMDIMQIDERGLWIDPVYQNLGSAKPKTPALTEPTDEHHPPPAPLPDLDAAHRSLFGNRRELPLRAASAITLAAATDDAAGPDWAAPGGVSVAGGVVADPRPLRSLAGQVARLRAEARRAGARDGQTRSVSDHGHGARHVGQHAQRRVDQ